MPVWEIVVSGRVQGVGYRYYVRESAKILALKGYVRNLSNGNVKIVVSGEKDKLYSLCELLRSGNHNARVDNLEIADLTVGEEYSDFTIRF